MIRHISTIKGQNAEFLLIRTGDDYTISTKYAVDSVAIRGLFYSSRNETLSVEYRSGSRCYIYEGVTGDEMMKLILAPSLGSFIAKNIKAEKTLAHSYSIYS